MPRAWLARHLQRRLYRPPAGTFRAASLCQTATARLPPKGLAAMKAPVHRTHPPLAVAVQCNDQNAPTVEADNPQKQEVTRRGSQPFAPRLSLRRRGFLSLIRDRECRQPFRLLLPAVPLLAD